VSTTTSMLSSLVAADRCDRCGAQAYVRVKLESGLDLLFCAHHARAYEPTLRAVAAAIQDESARLLQTAATASPDER
jgi:hypothetical protein